MTTDVIHQDDIGVWFDLTVTYPDGCRPVNISDATDLKVIILVPPTEEDSGDEIRLEHPAELSADGSDGRVTYISQDGDLPRSGNYKIQVVVTTPEGVWHSEIVKFKVKGNL